MKKLGITDALCTSIMSDTIPDMGQPLSKGIRVKVRGAARLLMRKDTGQPSVSLAPPKAGGGQERFSGASEVCVGANPGPLWGQGC